MQRDRRSPVHTGTPAIKRWLFNVPDRRRSGPLSE